MAFGGRSLGPSRFQLENAPHKSRARTFASFAPFYCQRARHCDAKLDYSCKIDCKKNSSDLFAAQPRC
jgi:hypothetical protein